jgi:hypothetical protein
MHLYNIWVNLQAQIELMTVPLDFTRLCNAVLQAEHGPDFLPIDDDRADRGNDGYLKSEKRMFAAHCFKRIQNQAIEKEIRTKMLGDLQKAIKLKGEGAWDIEAWTFLSNYPIPESIAVQVVTAGKQAGIDVSWRGSLYFAEVLQRVRSVREMFPNLLANDLLQQLDAITEKLDALTPEEVIVTWVPRTPDEQRALLAQKPRAWEYLLFAGVLFQGKERLEPKWRDFQTGHGRRTGRYLDAQTARTYLTGIWSDAESIAARGMTAFDAQAQDEAFGAPGCEGDPSSIEHLAERIVACYEDYLDWAAQIRGTVYPDEMDKAFALAAQVAAEPAEKIRNFIDHVVVEIGKVPEYLAQPDPQPMSVSLLLTLTVDEKLMAEFKKEARRLRK